MPTSKTRINITDILNNIFKESIDYARNKSKRLAEDSDPFDTQGDSAKSEKDTEELPNKEKEKLVGDEDTSKLKSGDISVDDVIEKLNAIRSGKSYKDEEILEKLTGYIENLEMAEKTALLAFLKALSQIVTGEVASSDIVQPTDKPVDIKIEKEQAAKKTTTNIKPTVIKKQSPESDKEMKTPAEDTKGPVPIVAKKK